MFKNFLSAFSLVLMNHLMSMLGIRFLIYLLFFRLYKGVSADKNALLTFSTKPVLLLLKSVCEMRGITVNFGYKGFSLIRDYFK